MLVALAYAWHSDITDAGHEKSPCFVIMNSTVVAHNREKSSGLSHTCVHIIISSLYSTLLNIWSSRN